MTGTSRRSSAAPAPPEDRIAIEGVAGTYYDAWFSADETRMRGVLHPDLAKRGIRHDLANGDWNLKNLTRDAMAR